VQPRFAVWLLPILLAACGAQATPKPAESPTLPLTATTFPTASPTESGTPYWVPEGFQLYTVAQDGFSIAMPAGWTVIQPSPENNSALLDAIAKAAPDSSTAQLDQMRAALATPSLRLLGADVASLSTRRFSTASVHIEIGASLTAEQAMTTMFNAAKAQRFERVEEHLVILRPGKAARVEYDIPNSLVTSSAAGEAAHVAEWWFPAAGKAYTITTFTSGGDDDIARLITIGTSFDLVSQST
jgi:hypothetical protein